MSEPDETPEQPQPNAALAVAPPAGMSDIDLATAPFTWRTLSAISRTEFVPKDLRDRPSAILACIMYGREWGLGPMESLQLIDVIDGSPSPAAQLLSAKVFAAGHEIYPKSITAEGATAVLVRHDPGRAPRSYELMFTIEDAKRIKTNRERTKSLADKENFRNYPGVMCYWRAASQLIRFVAPDVLGPSRAYTADELGSATWVPPQPGEEQQFANEVLAEIVEPEMGPPAGDDSSPFVPAPEGVDPETGEIVDPEDPGRPFEEPSSTGSPASSTTRSADGPTDTSLPSVKPETPTSGTTSTSRSPESPTATTEPDAVAVAAQELGATPVEAAALTQEDLDWAELLGLMSDTSWVVKNTVARMETKLRRLCELMVTCGVWKPVMGGLDPLHAALVRFQTADPEIKAGAMILAHLGDLKTKPRLVRFCTYVLAAAQGSVAKVGRRG